MEPTTALLGVLSGLVANRILVWLQALPFLSEEEKSRISGPLADWLAWAFSILTTYLVSLLLPYFGEHLTSIEALQVGALAITTSKVWYEGQKAIRK